MEPQTRAQTPTRPLTLDPADLPSPSPSVLQIIRACAGQEVTSRKLARLVSLDSVLTAALLRIVNSAYFGFAGKIKTIPHAITIIGVRSLRNLVLCISVRDTLQARAIPGFDGAAYTDDVLRRAVSARCLGATVGLDEEECFTLGLLQDFGLLALCYGLPEQASRYHELRQATPEQRNDIERIAFGATHDRVGQTLARAWGLPEDFVAAIGEHHQGLEPSAPERRPKLVHIAQCADWMAAVFSATAKQQTLQICQHHLDAFWGIDAKHCERLLAQVSESVEQAATDLGMPLRHHVTFEQIMREANLRLAAENLSYQELVWRLQETLQERDRLARERDRELQLAREIQRGLQPDHQSPAWPVTGLNVPARELSGDFFDYFRLADGRIYFGLADVAGKGINAALLMVKTSSLFRCLGKGAPGPSILLRQINDELCETATRGMFVTMVAGLYDARLGELRLVNAGHPPALLFAPNGAVRSIAAQTPPLGIFPGNPCPEVALQLAGGSLYLFSDGVIEGGLADGSALGLRGLVRLLTGLRERPPTQRLQAVVANLKGRQPYPQRRHHAAATGRYRRCPLGIWLNFAFQPAQNNCAPCAMVFVTPLGPWDSPARSSMT